MDKKRDEKSVGENANINLHERERESKRKIINFNIQYLSNAKRVHG